MNCAECGHPAFFHRANTVDQRHQLDDPVPCFAAVERFETTAADDRRAAESTYRACGCTAVHPLEVS